MKNLILVAIVAFAVPAFSHEHDHSDDHSILTKSRVTLATATSLEMFEDGQIGQLWGFETLKADDEASAKILYIDQNNTGRISGYDCHFHSHGGADEAHCHDAAELGTVAAPTDALTFQVDAFLESLVSALDTFERKIAPVEKITAVKMWQYSDMIHTSFTHEAATGKVQSHFMCHIHDGIHIDCHRSRNPGPQEPKF
ncbi:hypothetical protein [Bdellovibrio bacteriovorus]|uniref:hypothetical protein n=1 Tax=Bdellovibrio TaxID=958 RepID=UPI0035A864AD